MKRLLSAFAALAAAAGIAAWGSTQPSDKAFAQTFADSTLRVDLVAGTDRQLRPVVMVSGMSKSPAWHGRRVNTGRFPLRGNGRLTAVDKASGDTIYVAAYSSLLNEWLVTDLPGRRPSTFEHTVLMPLPRRLTALTAEFYDSRGRTVASTTWDYDPADILVATRPGRSPYDVRWLHGSKAESPRRIDVAILAEGYTAKEKRRFFAHAREAVDAILAHEPFASMADRFNFVAVATPSAESGVSHPLSGRWADTAFGSHFSTFYSDRYLTTSDIFSLYDALDGVPAEHIIVLANTDEYGGGGIFNDYTLTASRHPYFREVVVHEFGHSFGGLADEYFYEGDVMDDTYPLDVEPWEPNVTTLVDFNGKWENLLGQNGNAADSEAGLHEGAAYSFHGIYRSAPDCRMKTNEAGEFCPACQQALTRLIEFYTQQQKP